jgi:UDP-N-acetyl-D-mannosaminuronic acid transferase (WecB/TagA/CpsF family)
MEEKLAEYSDTINILLVARWTPLQENRVAENISKVQKNNLIVFTWWWLFDHLTWKQKRACKLIRILKLEWLWRLLCLRNKTQTEKVIKTFLWFKQLFCYLLLKKA